MSIFDVAVSVKFGYWFVPSRISRREEIFFNLPKDTLSVFIFHTDTLTEYTWNEVRDKYMILKRYDLSLDDLRRLNFKITYPPNEIMDNIKMYPPRSVEAVR